MNEMMTDWTQRVLIGLETTPSMAQILLKLLSTLNEGACVEGFGMIPTTLLFYIFRDLSMAFMS